MKIELDESGVPIDQKRLKGREFVHFKGGHYQLIDFALFTETRETMVVYRALYGEMGLWVRPAKMFFETVDRDGYHGPRFAVCRRRSRS